MHPQPLSKGVGWGKLVVVGEEVHRTNLWGYPADTSKQEVSVRWERVGRQGRGREQVGGGGGGRGSTGHEEEDQDGATPLRGSVGTNNACLFQF